MQSESFPDALKPLVSIFKHKTTIVMRSAFSLFVLFLVLSTSCKKKDNSSPTFPVNKYRIKEILTQTGGQNFSKELFTYNEEKLIEKELVPLQAVEDLGYTEYYSYDNNVITSISEGFLQTKTVRKLDGIKLSSIAGYNNLGGGYEIQSMAAFTYQGNLVDSYSYTEYFGADSTNTLNIETVITDNKIVELIGDKVWVKGQLYDTKIVFYYEGDRNTFQIQQVQIQQIWVDLYRWDYIYENDLIVKIQSYGYEDLEWVKSAYRAYEYNEDGYLSKEYNNYYTKTYTYEAGNGNAYIFDFYFFLSELDSTPYYKSGNLNEGRTKNLNQLILQQVISSQMMR